MISGHGRYARAIRVLAVAAVLPVTLLISPSVAFASISTPDALGVASSIAAPGTVISSASWVAKPANGTPSGVSNSGLAGFPTDGATFALLTTGDVNAADDAPPSTHPGTTTDLDGDDTHQVRGNKDFDVSILKIDFTVAPRMNCLRFDFRFLSEEFGDTFDAAFNDSFIAELDTSDWKTEGTSTITAPHNFAFDGAGHAITILSLGDLSMTAGPADTTYDGATQLLTASSPVAPGAHSLYLSIFDHGDRRYDSAVFVDNLVLGHAANPQVQCAPGAAPKDFTLGLTPATATHPVGTSHTVNATVAEVGGGPVSGGKVIFAASGANTATGSATTNASGQASFSYTGAAVGTDSISACYDADNDSICEPSEPFASVEAVWTAATTQSPSPSVTTTEPAGSELPKTGRPIGAIAGIGAFAVLLGAVAVFLVRRRREHVVGE